MNVTWLSNDADSQITLLAWYTYITAFSVSSKQSAQDRLELMPAVFDTGASAHCFPNTEFFLKAAIQNYIPLTTATPSGIQYAQISSDKALTSSKRNACPQEIWSRRRLGTWSELLDHFRVFGCLASADSAADEHTDEHYAKIAQGRSVPLVITLLPRGSVEVRPMLPGSTLFNQSNQLHWFKSGGSSDS